MSQAEELLNSLSDEVPVHTHPVPDTDTYFIIDPITRKIENTNRKKTVIMQYDHNSERFTFELPRYVDGHDMLECTSITVNVDNIELETEHTYSDAPDMTDLRVHPTDPEKVISSWLISRNSTQLAGKLSFHIEYKCVDSNGNVVYEWSTDTYDEIEVRARKKNGESAVIDHTDLLEQWRTRIFGAADSVMADIAAEGNDQIVAVKAESENQQNAVELKGAAALESIPEDYTAVNNMAEEAVRSKGDAIVCETAGEYIVLSDSSDNYARGLNLFGKTFQPTTTGKQLAYVNINVADYALNGVMCTATDDGNIVVSGTATEGLWNRLMSADLVAGETYTLGSNGALVLTVWDATAEIDIVTKERNVANITFTANNTGKHTFVLSNPAHSVFSSVRADIMVNVGSAALPWEPYSAGMTSPCPSYPQSLLDMEHVDCTVYGANLFPLREVSAVGVTGIPQGDGTVHYTGTSNSNAWQAYQECPIPANGTYTLYVETTGKTEKGSLIQIYDNNNLVGRSWQNVENNFSCTFDTVAGAKVRWSIGVVPDEVVNTTVKLSLNPGSVALPWEPYKSVQSIALNHTLAGIPVTSGGNYTDAEGQPWICDEIDFERGVYIKRLHEETYDGSDDERWKKSGESYFYLIKESMSYKSKANGNAMSTHFRLAKGSLSEPGLFMIGNAYGPMIRVQSDVVDETGLREWIAANPFTILYELDAPIETPLTADEIAAFNSLRTNNPNTTILNDAGAWMGVKYNADTKAYVDNPKVLKLVDSSTGVVYELKVINGNLTVTPIE